MEAGEKYDKRSSVISNPRSVSRYVRLMMASGWPVNDDDDDGRSWLLVEDEK